MLTKDYKVTYLVKKEKVMKEKSVKRAERIATGFINRINKDNEIATLHSIEEVVND